MNIHLTQAASIYLKEMIEKSAGKGFRLSIKKTGCSGYAYVPSVVAEINPNDELIECEGLKIFIDKKWLALLQDLEVDYIEEKKNGLKQKRLVFINPKEAGRCGCGESFNVE